MFESSNGNVDIQKENINGKGDYVITSGISNNGILGKTDIIAKVFDKNTLTVDMFGYTFYRNFKYKLVTHARVFSLKPLFKMTENQGLFFASSLNFLHTKFGYNNMCSWEKIKKLNVTLPIKNEKIDFQFMDSFINELEEKNVNKLFKFLNVNKLNDYELTFEERGLIENYKEIQFEEYSISDFFEVLTPKKKFDANKVNVLEKGKYPYIVRMSTNNGQKGYIDENAIYLNDANTLSFGQDTATVFYQEKQYFTGDKIKILKFKNGNLNSKLGLYFVSAIFKSFSKFSWGASSFSVDVINNQKIKVPVKNGNVDIETMETLVSAIQKLVIKDVVKYTNNKLNLAK